MYQNGAMSQKAQPLVYDIHQINHDRNQRPFDSLHRNHSEKFSTYEIFHYPEYGSSFIFNIDGECVGMYFYDNSSLKWENGYYDKPPIDDLKDLTFPALSPTIIITLKKSYTWQNYPIHSEDVPDISLPRSK